MNTTIISLLQGDLRDWQNCLVLADALEENNYLVHAAWYRLWSAWTKLRKSGIWASMWLKDWKSGSWTISLNTPHGQECHHLRATKKGGNNAYVLCLWDRLEFSWRRLKRHQHADTFWSRYAAPADVVPDGLNEAAADVLQRKLDREMGTPWKRSLMGRIADRIDMPFINPAVEEYWHEHYVSNGLCSLCANSGIIDTTGITSAGGSPVGRQNFCLCPNGQTLRWRGSQLHNEDQT